MDDSMDPYQGLELCLSVIQLVTFLVLRSVETKIETVSLGHPPWDILPKAVIVSLAMLNVPNIPSAPNDVLNILGCVGQDGQRDMQSRSASSGSTLAQPSSGSAHASSWLVLPHRWKEARHIVCG